MTKDLFDPKDTYAESFVKMVRADLNDIKHKFFKIGFRLAEANREKYYLELGYDSIVECAEDLFGFKKTMTYDLINVYNDFHDRLAPMCIQERYDKYSQTQLVQLSGKIWTRESFIKYVRQEDTIDTIKKAKKLWNKIYLHGRSPRGEFKTLQEFIDLYWDKYYPPTLPAQSTQEKDFSVQTENYIEVEAADEKPGAEDPKPSTFKSTPMPGLDQALQEFKEGHEDFSVQTEKLKDLTAKELEEYIKRMSYKTFFEPDPKKPGIRVLPDTLSKTMLIGISRGMQKNRTKVKHAITSHIVDNLGTFDYEISLYGRKQNFGVFAGMLAGVITDYLIKEFKNNE